jgi:hypothetical protein
MTVHLDDLLTALSDGRTITAGSPLHEVMHQASQEALRITAELNGSYHSPERVRELLSRLTGAPIDDSVTVFPPLSSDFGSGSGSAPECSSTPDADSRTTAASQSVTTASSATTSSSPP